MLKTKTSKIILGIIILIFLIIGYIFLHNYVNYTEPKNTFIKTFNQEDSIFSKIKIQGSDSTLEDLIPGENETDFFKINNSFSNPEYYYVAKSQIDDSTNAYTLFKLKYKRNSLFSTQIESYEYDILTSSKNIQEIIKDLKNQNKPETLNIQDFLPPSEEKLEQSLIETEMEWNKQKMLHEEFNKPETSKQRKIEILNELMNNEFSSSMNSYYKLVLDDVKSDTPVTMFEPDPYERPSYLE